MRSETLSRIDRATADLPERWRNILHETLLEGSFDNEAHRLIASALSVHRSHPPGMETAEAILAGDAFIPMAVETLLEQGVSLADVEEFLAEAIRKFDK